MAPERRYDIDWIRVIAILLLMVYHVAIVFQPWGLMIGFITNAESWQALWLPMTLLNIWRIPILFFIAGIGVFFSYQNRNWKELLLERGMRIGVPYLFGILFIAPLYVLILQRYYGWEFSYTPNPSHLWFLGNILCYVVIIILPAYYLKKEAGNKHLQQFKKILKSPLIFLLVIACFIVETTIVTPPIYEMYASTTHGFFLGLLAFLFGYLFAFAGNRFWNNLVTVKWFFLVLAVALFFIRLNGYLSFPLNINFPIETCCWVFTIFAFARQYLTAPNKVLFYFSKAAYPFYILHMIFLGLSCSLLLPLSINVQLKFCLVLLSTITGSVLSYELIKRNRYSQIIFGISNHRIKIK